jgi:hypothetical protein
MRIIEGLKNEIRDKDREANAKDLKESYEN